MKFFWPNPRPSLFHEPHWPGNAKSQTSWTFNANSESFWHWPVHYRWIPPIQILNHDLNSGIRWCFLGVMRILKKVGFYNCFILVFSNSRVVQRNGERFSLLHTSSEYSIRIQSVLTHFCFIFTAQKPWNEIEKWNRIEKSGFYYPFLLFKG